MLNTTSSAVVLSMLALAACGVDDDKPEDSGPPLPAAQVTKIEGTLKTVASSGDLKTVDCPDSIPAKADAEFKCETDQGTLDVTLMDAKGSEVAWSGKLDDGSEVTGRQNVFD